MPAKTQKPGKSAVPAVEKALEILEILASRKDGLTMNELVAASERTMGEIYRIVVYLTERGYLQHSPDTNQYALTLKLYELSHRYDPTERLIKSAVPLLERFADATQQSGHFAVPYDETVLVLTSVASPLPAGYAVRTGATFPLAETSSGHVILAFSSEAAQNAYLEGLNASQRAETQSRFERIRQDGFEYTPSPMVAGIQNLCVPVFDAKGVVGAMVSGYVQQIGSKCSVQEALNHAKQTAAELSARLGSAPETDRAALRDEAG